ncbi:unnamed protein product [Mytilus coruscus]|uniref:Uncharacterized protein n=1 Tax=Mytilus coruscus TaxID=42192 RepID=A0A6J8BEQ9_MYTCO|nr:unnamed protein product [Mytilus coruscus]
MDRIYYRDKIQEQLNDKQYYRELNDNMDKKTKRNINKLISKFPHCTTDKEVVYLTKFEVKTNNFYGLPKIHKSKEIETAVQQQNCAYIEIKSPKDLKFRPIVAGPQCPTHRLSHFIDLILKPSATERTDNAEDTNHKGRSKNQCNADARCITDLRQNKQVLYTNSVDTPSHGKFRREIKLANYDGTSEWSDLKSHFDTPAMINNWDDQEKGLYLATALRGQAQRVFSDLPTEKRMDYTTLIKALQERFLPPNQTELYRVLLKERREKASESLPELGQAIRRLVNKAYPNAPSEVKETLRRGQF